MVTLLQLSQRLERNDRERQRLIRAQWRLLGSRLKEARLNAGVGLRELARQMKVSAPFVADMEKGARHYSPKYVRAATAVFRLPNAPGEPRDL